MKLASRISLAAFLGLSLVPPLGALLPGTFSLRPLYAGLLALAAALSVLFCRLRPPKKSAALLTALPLLSLWDGLALLGDCPGLTSGTAILLSVAAAVYLALRFGRPLPLKAVTMSLFLLLLFPALLFALPGLFPFGRDTVVHTLPSPDGAREAHVIASSQGALGGDTLVVLQDAGGIDAGLFTLRPRARTVYLGEWGEFDTLALSWADDTRLLIDGVPYS